MYKIIKPTQYLFLLLSFMAFGCTNLATYSSDEYTFKYPSTYTIEEQMQSLPVLVVKGENGRVEIFRTEKDERIHGFSSSGLEEYEAKYVPKEKKEVGLYTVWLFYESGDEKTKTETEGIFESIVTLQED